jgi:hypothetical protein
MTEDEIIEALRGRVAACRPADHGHLIAWPVASPAQLEDVEAGLGFPLPALLRRIYREVANGGVSDRSAGSKACHRTGTSATAATSSPIITPARRRNGRPVSPRSRRMC